MAKRAVVIGAGIIGLCSADALHRHGFQVTVIDRDQPGTGASYGNGGLVVPSHFEPLATPSLMAAGLRLMMHRGSPFGFRSLASAEVIGWLAKFMKAAKKARIESASSILLAMNLASRELYETRFSDIDADYQRTGELMVCETERALAGEWKLADTASRLGLEVEVLDRDRLRQFETGVELVAAGAVYFADDARLSPPAFLKGLREKLKLGAVTLRDGLNALSIEADRVVTSEGELPSDLTVVAGGAWSTSLCRSIGLALPLLGGKGYGFTLPDPKAMPRLPGILVGGRVAYNPMSDGLRFVGTMELGPAELGANNSARIEGIRHTIRKVFPQLAEVEFPNTVWSGFRPCAPDGMPYIGRVPACPNCIVATGHGMMGMSLGPITGQLVGEIAANLKPSIPLDLIAPERYA